MPNSSYLVIKRSADCSVSLILLIFLAPLFLLVYLLVFFSMGAPVFFVQTRIGEECIPFKMYKFRSMLASSSKQKNNYYTTDNDPRITKIGRFLRIFSIDELPQLWNVFIGNMSLVGPRPYVEAQAVLYSAMDWRQRHSVKPGITGLAQVSGRSKLSFDNSLIKDLTYTKQCCFLLDLRILLKTLIALTGSSSN